jgi:hypothetical protein
LLFIFHFPVNHHRAHPASFPEAELAEIEADCFVQHTWHFTTTPHIKAKYTVVL